MPDPYLRAADTDREAVATALCTHMAAGRLTLAEYEDRVARAWAARTYGELARLTADLPAPMTAPAPTLPRPARGPCGPVWTHDHPEHGWQAWLSTSVTVLVVYLVIALASWELHHFWPAWVIGPWGAVLLARALLDRGVRSGARG
jgi:Domain of unknown function (DUF1707)